MTMSELRQLLDLPLEVKKSDYVVRLTEGVANPEATVASYATTPGILGSFDRALSLVQAAIRDGHSEATFIHGSFGSGKSHFMAVLSLMLGNHDAVWSVRDFHELRARHEWLKDARVLRLHFHMIGARTTEEKLFPAYLDHVRRHHPDQPLPALFEDEALFENADSLRRSMGDEAFFAGLNAGVTVKKGWGALATKPVWDTAAYDQARTSLDREQRDRLFSALVRSHFPAFTERGTGFVSLDIGLGRLSRHAARLGYQAVVLFLDELILWLASRAGNKDWLAMEVQKLAKLVEAQDERRDVPLVSFIARQRDIGEMVGEQLSGMEMQNIRDVLKWWEGRFNPIRLEDRNLPTVVEKRVVRARDQAARARLDEAFASMRRTLGNEAWGTLLADMGDEKGFRQVYPFSPALIEVLVALSSCLQRERTALKVLVELLIEHLEDFALGQLVPVGDLFDVLAGGEEPMDSHMRERFAAARRLYTIELLPRIQEANGTASSARCQRLRDEHPVHLGCSNCAEARCRADNRLVKTLLLAALVPELSTLRGLTVSRLVQLNHGTLRSPIPGTEAGMAAKRLRDLAAQLGKVRVEGEDDPRVSVVLEGVDIEPIIESASGYNSPGARRQMVREILYDALGLPPGSEAVCKVKIDWRGTRRQAVIRYGNVREMDDATLRVPDDAELQLVIDYPFDDPGHRPEEDEERIAEFMSRDRAATVVWLPNFFGERLKNDLGKLVIIRRILEDSMRTHLANLRPDDQLRARDELEHMQSQKRQLVRRALEAAYGLRRPDEGELDPAYRVEQHVHVLTPGWHIRGVTESVLSQAVDRAARSLLDLRYPRHPYFDKVTPQTLRTALERFEKLCEEEGQRLAISKQEQREWDLLEKLGMVSATEAWATLQATWVQDIDRALRQDGIDRAPTVAQVRRRLDPDPEQRRGLPVEVADVEVIGYAMASRRELLRAGVPVREVVPGKLAEDIELCETPLPGEKAWQEALDRAGRLFGLSLGGRACNARTLRRFVDGVREARQRAVAERAHEIAGLLARWGELVADRAPRMATAERAAELIERLDTRDAIEMVAVLAELDPAPSSWPALARHLGHADKVARTLEDDVLRGVVAALAGHDDEPRAGELLAEARIVLAADELNQDLASRLRTIGVEAQRLAARGVGDELGEGPVETRGRVVARGEGQGLGELDATRETMERALAEAGPGGRLMFAWRVIKA
jgi:hypothetical protein